VFKSGEGAIFEEMDLDHSGTIDFQEFKVFLSRYLTDCQESVQTMVNSIQGEQEKINMLKEQLQAASLFTAMISEMGSGSVKPQTEDTKKALADCVGKKGCTYQVTGRDYWAQKYYTCSGCGFGEGSSICEACAENCHKGHKSSLFVKEGPSFCDCGANKDKKCGSLPVDFDQSKFAPKEQTPQDCKQQ